MRTMLLVPAAGLVLLGWWTTTLGKTEIQAVLSAELVVSGVMLSALALIGDWLTRSQD
jgi:hypothetical protein